MSRLTKSVLKLKNLIFGDKNYIPFIVLSTARTGSNLLRSYLNNHPDIHVEGEILKKINNRDPQKIIDNCWSPQPKHFKAIGFKLFYGHPFDESDKNSWKPILEKQNLHVIHLKRHNAIRSFISERIAFNNDEWLNNNPGHIVNKDPIHYNPNKLIQKLNQLEKEQSWTETFFTDVPKIEIEYDELTQNTEQIMHLITEFLEVRYIPVATPLIRQNPEPMSKLVINWDEITSALKGSKWEKYLNE